MSIVRHATSRITGSDFAGVRWLTVIRDYFMEGRVFRLRTQPGGADSVNRPQLPRNYGRVHRGCPGSEPTNRGRGLPSQSGANRATSASQSYSNSCSYSIDSLAEVSVRGIKRVSSDTLRLQKASPRRLDSSSGVCRVRVPLHGVRVRVRNAPDDPTKHRAITTRTRPNATVISWQAELTNEPLDAVVRSAMIGGWQNRIWATSGYLLSARWSPI